MLSNGNLLRYMRSKALWHVSLVINNNPLRGGTRNSVSSHHPPTDYFPPTAGPVFVYSLLITWFGFICKIITLHTLQHEKPGTDNSNALYATSVHSWIV